MPLIMDDDMDVELNGLFGDGDEISLPASPPSKELFQRIDELRGSGACQGLAWSRMGCIASILPNGSGLQFRTLRCHPYDGTWDLSNPTDYPKMNPSVEGGPLQHVCWSPNGSDLAVIDAGGRTSIFTMTNSLNKPNFARNGLVEHADDLHAVVGAYWLNQLPLPRAPVMYSQSVKSGTSYRYDVAQAITFGPCHPNPGKSALVCLTTSGVLRLVWIQSDGRWYETTHEIESVVSSNDLITHASICADKNQSLLVAFATTAKELRIIRMTIKWGNKPSEAGQMPNSAQITVNPTIMVVHLAVANWMDVNSTEGPGFMTQSSLSILSHLEMIPPCPDMSTGRVTLPTILTVRSYLPVPQSQFNQSIESVIDRWELRESTQMIHPVFEQLSSRRGSTGSQILNAVSLRKIEGFTVNKIVICVQAMALDRVVCFGYSDGTFEYRDRISMSETYTNGSLDRFSHASQVGFSYIDEEPCLQMAMSPTTCSFVQMGTDGRITWKPLRHHMDDLGKSEDDSQYAAAISSLAMSLANSVMGNINHDDILALAHNYGSDKEFASDFLIESSRILKFHVDYSEESHHDTLIRNPSIQLCMSVLNSMGYHGDSHPRSFGAKLAWISLQVRNCVILMTMAVSLKMPDANNNKFTGLEDADVVRILSGSVSWCLDLFSWIIDCLVHPEDATIFSSLKEGAEIDMSNLNTRLRASNNIALHLLFASSSRGYLTAICRRLTHLDYTARKAMSNIAQSQAQLQTPQLPITPALRDAYTHAATLTQSSTVQIRHFETLLTSLSASIKDSYTSAGLPALITPQPQPGQNQPRPIQPNTPRNGIEHVILFGGDLPPALTPTLKHLFTTLLPILRNALDPAKLFFHNFDLLALDPVPSRADDPSDSKLPSPATTPQKELSRAAKDKAVRHTIDILQRIPINLGTSTKAEMSTEASVMVNGQLKPVTVEKRYRRCVRCGAVMEDMVSGKTTVQFLIMQQRRCFCNGYWLVMTGGQVVV